MHGKSTLLRFFKTAVTYFVGNVSTKLIAFLLIPIYTAALNPEEYGGYDLIVSILNLIVPLAFCQIWDGVFRFAFDKDNLEHKKFIINNGWIVTFLGIIILILLELVLKIIYPQYINEWVLLYGTCYGLQYFYTVVARVYLNNLLFSISGVVSALISAVLNIYLIKCCGMGVNSLYIAASIGIMVQLIIIEIKFRPLSSFHIRELDRKCIKDMVRFSFPLCISTIAYWMLNGYSKILISGKLGVYDNGLYAIANKFTSLILIVVSVIQFAWNEMVYIMANEKEKKNIYEIGIRFIFSATMLSAGAFLFIARLLFPFVVDASYSDAMVLIPISMIGVAMNSFASFSGTLFLANKKSSFLLLTTFFAVITNAILSSILLHNFKLYGVLIALAVSLTILTITRLIALYHEYKIKLSVSNYIAVVILILTVVVYYMFNTLTSDICMIALVLASSFFLMKNEINTLMGILFNRRRFV